MIIMGNGWFHDKSFGDKTHAWNSAHGYSRNLPLTLDIFRFGDEEYWISIYSWTFKNIEFVFQIFSLYIICYFKFNLKCFDLGMILIKIYDFQVI